MSNGNGTSYKPGSMGNIKDLLRQANSSRRETMPWNAGTNDGKFADSQPEKDISKFAIVQGEEGKDAAKEEKTIGETQTQQAAPSTPNPEKETSSGMNEIPETVKPTEKESQPVQPVKPPAKDSPPKERKPPKATVRNERPHKKGSYKDIESRIDSFNSREENCKRHWIFLPADVSATLYYAYGERRLSAVLTTLARDHIDDFREEIRRSIADKSNVFNEKTD